MADIKLSNVSKTFGKVSVIEDLNLTIHSGEFLVLLGPSGSGKTTILRMIAGLETIDQGTLEVGGLRCESLPPGQRQVAMVFQNYALYPHMSVSGNMAFGLENIGLGKAEIATRIAAAAKLLEMTSLLERYPSQLSGGQRQRVAIGRAIVKQPKAFLFDEPLSNLDAALRVRTRVELAQLHQRLKSTVVYVTHDQTEAMTLADRVVVLNNRHVEQIGTPMEIYHRPATRFVASFVGSPAMNFIQVKTAVKNKKIGVVAPSGKWIALASASISTGDVELGIRPESISIVERDADATGQVKIIERLGERT
ncbi:MAG: sn-glycerol-3-phosphate ABC transporter ATP-binding protein UgpC, partial [Pseudomonadota bacterium]|nr:sn-glycerol-3-phosphate ABC transporter ATP-binding protein UgpC [Pseudomonadota bacterium]